MNFFNFPYTDSRVPVATAPTCASVSPPMYFCAVDSACTADCSDCTGFTSVVGLIAENATMNTCAGMQDARNDMFTFLQALRTVFLMKYSPLPIEYSNFPDRSSLSNSKACH